MPTTLNVGKPAPTRGRWTIGHYEVTAAQTFKAGDWVYLTDAGTISIAATASNDVGALDVLGIAQANAADCLTLSGDAARCPVSIPTENGEFLTQIYHSTGASATFAITDLGVGAAGAPSTYPLRNQGGVWVANKENNGTNDAVAIVERHQAYPYGEQYGWFWARLITGARAFANAS